MGRSIGFTTSTYAWDTVGLPLLLQETSGASNTTYVYGRPVCCTPWTARTTPPIASRTVSGRALANASGAVTDTHTYDDAFGAVHRRIRRIARHIQ